MVVTQSSPEGLASGAKMPWLWGAPAPAPDEAAPVPVAEAPVAVLLVLGPPRGGSGTMAPFWHWAAVYATMETGSQPAGNRAGSTKVA